MFAVVKSGTVSLEICNAKIPSVIIYKMGMINFFIVKMLVKVKFANIINIAANETALGSSGQYNADISSRENDLASLFTILHISERTIDVTADCI